jgi:hypothetical protein
MSELPEAAKSENLGKLSIKKMFGALGPPLEARPLCVIYGVADDFKARPTDAGQLITISGAFAAIEIITPLKQEPQLPGIAKIALPLPRRWDSDRCVLPAGLEKQVLAKLYEAQKNVGKVRIEFAAEISIVPRSTALGFDIVFKNIIAPVMQAEDPLGRVRAEAAKFLANQIPESA